MHPRTPQDHGGMKATIDCIAMMPRGKTWPDPLPGPGMALNTAGTKSKRNSGGGKFRSNVFRKPLNLSLTLRLPEARVRAEVRNHRIVTLKAAMGEGQDCGENRRSRGAAAAGYGSKPTKKGDAISGFGHSHKSGNRVSVLRAFFSGAPNGSAKPLRSANPGYHRLLGTSRPALLPRNARFGAWGA